VVEIDVRLKSLNPRRPHRAVAVKRPAWITATLHNSLFRRLASVLSRARGAADQRRDAGLRVQRVASDTKAAKREVGVIDGPQLEPGG